MTFRLLLAFALSILPLAGHAADCVKDGTLLSAPDAICGSLKIVERRRDDQPPNVDISATYAVFDPEGNAAERRYNEWVRRHPAQMNFAGPVEIPPYSRNVADTMASSLYRSPKLLSAVVGGWMCCGAHGFHWDSALNMDPITGSDLPLGDFVRLTPVANFCWKQFSQIGEERGAVFVERYSLSEPFTDEDLAVNLSAIPADRIWTAKEMLAGPLLGSTSWYANEEGLTIIYGELLGYWASNFECHVTSAELRQFIRPGVSIPF